MEHHIVPRFYLRAFVEPATPPTEQPAVWVADTECEAVYRRSPKNAARLTNYYAFALNEGGTSHSVEGLLGRVESLAAPVLRGLAEGCLELTADEIGRLAFFIAMQITRVPAAREPLDRAVAATRKIILDMLTHDQKLLDRHLRTAFPGRQFSPEERNNLLGDSESYRVVITPDESLLPALEVARRIAPDIARMSLALFRVVGSTRLWTSDNPVSRRSPSRFQFCPGGLEWRDIELTFPVTPTVCLMATWSDVTGVMDISEQGVEELNGRTREAAQRFVFTSSELEARRALAWTR